MVAMGVVITVNDNVKHRVRAWSLPLVITNCGVKVMLGATKCPESPEHLVALPDCPNHRAPRKCNDCG